MSNENFKESGKGEGAEHGKYKDGVLGTPLEQRMPQQSLPKAPDPSPFSVGGGKK